MSNGSVEGRIRLRLLVSFSGPQPWSGDNSMIQGQWLKTVLYCAPVSVVLDEVDIVKKRLSTLSRGAVLVPLCWVCWRIYHYGAIQAGHKELVLLKI